MESTNLNICTDKTIKATEKIFEGLGLNMTTAAIEAGGKLAYDKSIKGYTDMDELKAVLSQRNTK